MPEIFMAVLAGLLVWRVAAAVRRRVRKPIAAVSNNGKARFWKGEMRVIEMKRETPSVRTFRLAPVDGGAIPFTFLAGQFLNLALEIDGKKVSRSYTIASPPSRDTYLELTIKREAQGRVSQYLHDMLMTGHTVSISAPAGRFSFIPATANAVLLIAGGVGITPVMSILRDLTNKSWPGKIDLVFSVRSLEEVIFADELKSLTERHPNFHLHLTITRDAPLDWTGKRGRVSAALLKECVGDFVSRRTFICGPDEMAQSTRDQLIAAGVPAGLITVESFTPAAAVSKDDGSDPAAETGATSTLTFARSGQSVPLPSNKSILEVAELAGVQIDYDCRSGICGQCRCKLLEGRVTMKVRDALSDADEAEGYILACQAHGVGDCTVDV